MTWPGESPTWIRPTTAARSITISTGGDAQNCSSGFPGMKGRIMSAGPEVLIDVRGLVKVQGRLPVLRGLDLTLRRGEFVALTGPNGSGKSTLLRLLAGLSRPDGGSIHIGGWQVPAELAALRAQIGYVGHETLLYDQLSATENLRFCARLYGLAEAEKRIPALLERVGLARRAQDRVRNYSRGMQQRLAIARALLHDPAVLLLDEPFDGLDAAATEALAQLLRSSRERSIIMATHRLGLAEQLADRAVILLNGVVKRELPLERAQPGDLASRYSAETEAT